MKSTVKKILAVAAITLLFATCSAPAVLAQNVFCPEGSINGQTPEFCQSQSEDPIAGPGGLISDITNIVSIVVGIVAVVMVIVGGFMFVTSSGDSSKLQNAKKAITWSIIGLVVVVLARTIIVFVINRV